MASHLPPKFTKIFLTVFSYIEAVVLTAITIATIYAMTNEFFHVFHEKNVTLNDILLMFIYLEILAMIQQFVVNGKIPVRYPIYIAIMAIARYITLGMKELQSVDVVWLAIASLLLAAATVVIRVGQFYWPYKQMPNR